MDDTWSPRAEWTDLPGAVRAGVEQILGSPVTSAVNQVGGMSPGLAARVRTADGERSFVKAVGDSLNPRSPDLHRREAHAVALLPAEAPVPALRALYDDGSWVALVFDEVPGRMPRMPWDADELATVAEQVVGLSRILTPCPDDSVATAADELRHDFTAYLRLQDDPPPDLEMWERRHLGALADLSAEALNHLHGDTLVHLDMRADNVLLDRDGQAWFVDWPWACRGADWIDSVMLAMNATVDGLDPEPLIAANPLLRQVDPWHVTGLLAGLAGMLTEMSRHPDPPGLPTLRRFQRRQHAALLPWIRRRTAWG